ncbi:S-adenosylmethionine decarboxylase [archaeon]|jgi:S-adenosylmethionine/arginine decarboxylase-like enzyme|nr:S-adenosylmethionine decarboxylase [archaeon]|tara:strand:- start:374 stop:748 length:375 start_codon:yes stop_codon:yes gene_type:complete
MNNGINKNNMWGMTTSIDLHGCNPDTIRNAEKIKRFVKDLVKLIGMKAFGETQVVHFGEDEKVEGFSMIQLIETSLISGHFANQTNNVYLDIFSCRSYNPQVVAEFTKKFFEAKDYNLKTIYRK